jgi:hypothetical protein
VEGDDGEKEKDSTKREKQRELSHKNYTM